MNSATSPAQRSLLMRFFTQRVAAYRNFQIVFTILTLNFAIPSVIYIVAPQLAHQQFLELNALLGGKLYVFPEYGSSFWRYLGSANVATLAFMCFLLQLNLRRWYPVLVPLTFMKSLAATLWLVGWVQSPEYPAFLAAALLDYASSIAFVFFARRAHDAIEEVPDETLIPAPMQRRS